MATYKDVLQAAARIQGRVHKTPVMTSATIDKLTNRKVYFKCENLQKTGAFKARGALNAVLKLKEENPSVKGVVTHSSGNHGLALAWAAREAGIPCVVVVPDDTSKVKSQAIAAYGAQLVLCKPTLQDREQTCLEVARNQEFTLIPPFDHYDVIAGQGTIALEFLEQEPDLDAILVAISGGGMISGIAIAAKAIKPSIKVYAVEPVGKELGRSLEAGKKMWQGSPQFLNTIADGIRIQMVGNLTFPIVVELVEKQVFTVLVIETSSGAGVAAVLSDEMKNIAPEVRKIGVILCGGNVDIDQLPWSSHS